MSHPRYVCSETEAQKKPSFSWSKEVTTQCCQTCNGTVVPGGTILEVEKMEDKCGTVKTVVCKIRNRVTMNNGTILCYISIISDLL